MEYTVLSKCPKDDRVYFSIIEVRECGKSIICEDGYRIRGSFKKRFKKDDINKLVIIGENNYLITDKSKSEAMKLWNEGIKLRLKRLAEEYERSIKAISSLFLL